MNILIFLLQNYVDGERIYSKFIYCDDKFSVLKTRYSHELCCAYFRNKLQNNFTTNMVLLLLGIWLYAKIPSCHPHFLVLKIRSLLTFVDSHEIVPHLAKGSIANFPWLDFTFLLTSEALTCIDFFSATARFNFNP